VNDQPFKTVEGRSEEEWKKENEGVLGLKGHIVDHVEFDRRQSTFFSGV
jgi:hypothetical protein